MAYFVVRTCCNKPPLMGHHNGSKSLLVVALAAHLERQQQLDTQH